MEDTTGMSNETNQLRGSPDAEMEKLKYENSVLHLRIRTMKDEAKSLRNRNVSLKHENDELRMLLGQMKQQMQLKSPPLQPQGENLPEDNPSEDRAEGAGLSVVCSDSGINQHKGKVEKRGIQAEKAGKQAGIIESGAGKEESHAGKEESHAGRDIMHAGREESHTRIEEAHARIEEAHARIEEAHAGKEETHAGSNEAHTGRKETHAGNEVTHAGSEVTHAGSEVRHAGGETGPAVTSKQQALADEPDGIKKNRASGKSKIPLSLEFGSSGNPSTRRLNIIEPLGEDNLVMNKVEKKLFIDGISVVDGKVMGRRGGKEYGRSVYNEVANINMYLLDRASFEEIYYDENKLLKISLYNLVKNTFKDKYKRYEFRIKIIKLLLFLYNKDRFVFKDICKGLGYCTTTVDRLMRLFKSKNRIRSYFSNEGRYYTVTVEERKFVNSAIKAMDSVKS